MLGRDAQAVQPIMVGGRKGRFVFKYRMTRKGEGLRTEFKTLLNSVDPAVLQEIVGVHAAVDEFAIEMKLRFAEKAIKGMRVGTRKRIIASRNRLRDQALAPAGQEVDIANVAMILRYLNGETKAPRETRLSGSNPPGGN